MSEFISLVIAGIVTGSIYAVSASGLVVTYNTTGIFNFAHGALGMGLAYLFWQLWQGWHWPVLLALAVGSPRGGAHSRGRGGAGGDAPPVRCVAPTSGWP